MPNEDTRENSSTALRWFLLSLATIASAAGIGLLDYWTGPDLSLSLLYLVPIVASGWWLGKGSAASTAVASASAWMVADAVWQGELQTVVSAWNGISRLVIFVFMALMTAYMRSSRDQQIELNNRLERLLREEASLARVDPVTMLPNARSFMERRTEIARSRRTDRAFCVAYLDLDNFKLVNDLHGHLVGDLALRHVAEVIRESIRASDVCARLGGDEFAILFTDVRPDGVEEMARRLVAGIVALGKKFPGSDFGASVGAAYYQRPPQDEEAIILSADRAMYEAKRAGKGNVVFRWFSGEGGDQAETLTGASTASHRSGE